MSTTLVADVMPGPADALTRPALSLAPTGPAVEAVDLLMGYTGRQRAAILLLELGPDECGEVLGRLSEEEIEDLSTEVARLESVPPEVTHAVLKLFGKATVTSTQTHGGFELARELLVNTVGADRAANILERVAATMVEMPFHAFHTLDPRQIVSVLGDEHPQIMAIVLAHLPTSLASEVLAAWPATLQSSVAHRIAVMDRTSPEFIRRVESGLERRLSSLGVPSTLSTVGGVRPLVDIINRSDRGTEVLILQGLERIDPSLAELVRKEMFMFEDIAGLEDRAIQLVLRQVPPSDLAPALKGVKDTVRAKLMQNLSERAALDLAEELEILGPVRIATVQEAQSKIVAVVRDLEQSGQIVVSRGDEDEFVA